MKKWRVYTKEVRDEVIGRFKESGLSQTQFCNLSNVTITDTTISKWILFIPEGMQNIRARDTILHTCSMGSKSEE